ncbi:MAG: hypothetical protein BIFFINMI_01610 [Phycisphaerae bacterium]|nr:hypothetical protein [Phycisphaerae bacterium]
MSRSAKARAGAFTLAELIISLAVGAFVLSAAAALAFAVGHAWNASDDVNELVNHGRNGAVRIAERIRAARAVGYVSNRHLVLWREDSNGDGKINLDELTVYYLNKSSNELMEGQVVMRSDTDARTQAANDYEVTTDDFTRASIVSTLTRASLYQEGPVADYVSAIDWVIDLDAPYTRLVQLRLTLTKDNMSQTLQSGASLRAPLELE